MKRLLITLGLAGIVLIAAACSNSKSTSTGTPTPDAPTPSATPTPEATAPPTTEDTTSSHTEGDHEVVPGDEASPVRPGDAAPNPGAPSNPIAAPDTAGLTLYRQNGGVFNSGDTGAVGEYLDVKTGVGSFAPNSNVTYKFGNIYTREWTAAGDGSVSFFTIDIPATSGCHSYSATDTAGTSYSVDICV